MTCPLLPQQQVSVCCSLVDTSTLAPSRVEWERRRYVGGEADGEPRLPGSRERGDEGGMFTAVSDEK